MAGLHESNKIEKVESATAETKKNKDSKEKKVKKKVDLKKSSATLFYGVGKEFNRITWTSKDKMIWNFLVIVVIAIVLTLIFVGIDYIFLTLL